MKIFSYNDNQYPALPKGTFDETWPLQFLAGFSDFYREYHNNSIVLLHDEATDAWLPLRIITSKIFRFGQILHSPVRNAVELSGSEQQAFFTEMTDILRNKLNLHRLIQPHPSGIMLAAPAHSRSIPFGTYITDLESYPDDETLLGSYDTKYRKAVQHSIKNGGRVVIGDEAADDFHRLYTMTAKRAGLHIDPPEYFQLLRKKLGPNGTATGVVYDEAQPIGGIFMLYSKYSALCTHAGSGGESKLYGGMKHLHFEMMKHLRDSGVRYYDLVGVRIGSTNPTLEGIFRFKKGFGGTLKEGYLWKTDLKPIPMKIYDLVQKLRHSQSAFDIIDQESAV